MKRRIISNFVVLVFGIESDCVCVCIKNKVLFFHFLYNIIKKSFLVHCAEKEYEILQLFFVLLCIIFYH
jgi:hypothetical protein